MTPRWVTFWELMKKFEAEKLVTSIRALIGTTSMVGGLANNPARTNLIQCVKKQLDALIVICNEANLQASVSAIKMLSKLFDGSIGEELVARVLLDNIWKTLTFIEGEMGMMTYFVLNPSESDQYQNPLGEWMDIVNRFKNPELTRNIEEMVRCFVLSRYSGSMYHAMQVAEWGAIELGHHIGVTDPKLGWGPTDKKLRELLSGGHGKFSLSLSVTFEFVEQMAREVNSMMLAWRHKIDHAANHLSICPNTEFAPDLAEHIIGAVKVFMTRLVEGIPK